MTYLETRLSVVAMIFIMMCLFIGGGGRHQRQRKKPPNAATAPTAPLENSRKLPPPEWRRIIIDVALSIGRLILKR